MAAAAAAAVTAAAAPCPPNSDDWSNAGRGDKRCVFNSMYSTRRRINSFCLTARPALGTHFYQSNECSNGGGIESIGQARAIKYLNDHLGVPPPAQPGAVINPDVQWETYLNNGRDRPDIVYYDRVGTSFAEVVEAKVKGNPDYEGWGRQVGRYVAAIAANGVNGVRAGSVLDRWGGYEDWFQVYGKGKTCPLAGGAKGYQLSTYRATSPASGLLDIREVKKERKCERQKDPADPNNPPAKIPVVDEDDDDFKWEPPDYLLPLIRGIRTVGPTTLAEDIGAYGSVELAAAELTAEVELFLASQAGRAFLLEAGFATIEMALALGVVALVGLILWWYFTHHGSLVKGEPHFTTPDNLGYDLQSVGEFILAQSDKWNLEIQGRLSPASGGRDVSVMFDAAMEAGDHLVEFHEDDLYIDNQKRTLETGKLLHLGKNAFILRKDDKWAVMFDGVAGPALSWRRGAASLYMPPTPDSDLVGLLGNADGNPKNDLRLRDGTQLPANASPTVLHSSFADSWRIDDNESLFTYGPGQSTATFTNKQFPAKIVSIADLTPEQVQLATTQCEANGVPAGLQFNDCILDIALTADTSFAKAAAEQTKAILDPTAQAVNEDGDLAIDFQGALSSNVRPSRVSTDPAVSAFAGPFSGTDSYRFYAQSLPSHKSGTLSFDLLAVGDWASDSDTETVQVETDRGTPYTITPSTLTPVATGKLATGLPWAKYRITMPITHNKSQIEFKTTATGVAGISNQAFGIDNVNLDLDVTPPQTFTVSLPFTASDGVPAAGAGNLETEVARDEYQFTLGQPGSIFVDAQECPGLWLNWELFNAAGASVASNSMCGGKRLDNLAAGAYRLRVSPHEDEFGAYKLSVSTIAPDVVKTAAVGGPKVSLATTQPGQYGTWTFAGTTGQKVSFEFTDGTLSSSIDATLRVKRPDGAVLASQSCGKTCFIDTETLPVTGTYSVVWDPKDAKTGSLALQLFEVSDLTGTVALGAPSTLTTTIPGQDAYWSFAGKAGQRIAFGVSGLTGSAYASVRKPDGTPLYGSTYCSTACAFNTVTLPADGTYTIVVDPTTARPGPMTAGVIAGDITGSLTVGGAAVKLTTTGPGQNATWSFAGTAGQRIAFALTGGTWDNNGYARASVRNPDGTDLFKPTYCQSSCTFDTVTLPVTGTYTVVADPYGATVGSISAQVVAGDVTGSLTAGGAPVKLTTTGPGQKATWSFAGTAGQRIAFVLTGATFDNNGYARASVRYPDGSDLFKPVYCQPSCAFDTSTLPETGTYTVVADPYGTAVGSISAQVVAGDVTGTLTPGGAAVKLTTTEPGQNPTWSLAGKAGQRISITISGGTFTSAQASVLGPDGSVFLPKKSCSTSCFFDATVLPADGTYQVVVDPAGIYTGSGSAQVNLVAQDVAAQVTVGGAASTLTTTIAGQHGVWTFAGTEGQQVSFNFTGSTFTSSSDIKVKVKKPDGTDLVADTRCGVNCLLEPTVLPVTGTYTVELNPQNAKTGSLTLQLYTVTHLTGSVIVGGAASSLTTTTPGQNGTWSFSGTSGRLVSFNFTEASFAGATGARVSVKKPDGSVLVSATYCGRNCFLEPVALPVAGTYTVEFDPQDGNVGKLTAQLYTVTDLTGSVTVGGAASSLTTTAPGQNGTWSFSGTSGRLVSFNFTDANFANSTGAQVTVKKPDGTVLVAATYCGRNCFLDPVVLPATGTYTVEFNPRDEQVGKLTLRIYSVADLSPVSITIGGATSTLTTVTPGQNGTWTFNGTANQKVTFTFTNSSFGSSVDAQVSVKKPDGTALGSPSYCGRNCTISATTLPATGTYTILFDPKAEKTGALTVKLALAS
ncbi:VWD domain-containing protein [Nonomuraea sp. NPDC050680]|uniref:VWD domain-containing protein n=1 Tax=Nonomuraea sp. NPDC050680 TaxID=3154630 RepID=UPI0033F28B1E